MSFDHWWIGFFVDNRTYEQLKPHFVAAVEQAVLSSEAQQALLAWQHRPSDFEEDAFMRMPEAVAGANAFIAAFNLPGFNELAHEILTQDGPYSNLATEQHLFRMAIAARHTPVSIVWHALGYERAKQLPGQMGNMLLRPDEIADAQEAIRHAYAGTSPQNLLAAARRYCGSSVDDDTLGEVIGFLPDGLSRAWQNGTGFVALARPQI
jgi:hypothetical protein